MNAALEQQEAAFAIYESTFGAQHTLVATVLTRIAAIHRKKGDLDQAMQLAERAYSINEASLGNESPALAGDLAEMARIEADRGATQAAEARYRRRPGLHLRTIPTPRRLQPRRLQRRRRGTDRH